MQNMTHMTVATSVLSTLLIATASYAAEDPKGFSDVKKVTAAIINSKNEKIGTATFSDVQRGVKIELEVSKLSPGKHGVHIHEKGECKAPDFKSAGEHYNPNGQAHGVDHSGGSHVGDLPNLIVDEKGNAKTEMYAQNLTLNVGASALLKKGNTSLVIHASPDDDKSQPAGNAGDRQACAVIKRN